MTKNIRFPLRVTCPKCGCEADAATGVGPKAITPSEGDISFCLYCGVVRTFVMDGTSVVGFRIATEEGLAALDEESRAMLAKTRASYALFLRKMARVLGGRDPASLSPGERQLLRTALAAQS